MMLMSTAWRYPLADPVSSWKSWEECRAADPTQLLQLSLHIFYSGKNCLVKKFLDPDCDTYQHRNQMSLLLVRCPTPQIKFTRMCRQFFELSTKFIKCPVIMVN